MSYGIKVSDEEFDTVSSFCENKDIDFSVWNAGEFFFGKGSEAELEFESKKDRDTVRDFVVQLRSTERTAS